MNLCLANGCNRESYARGYCKKHLNQIYTYGEVLEYTKFEPNKILVEGNVGYIVLCNEKRLEVGRAIFDLQDMKVVKSHKWYLNNYGYAITRINRKKQVFLHRLIMQPPETMQIDHINGNTLDNRRCNLRLCTKQQNMYNQKMRCDNTSGYTGVDYDKRRKKWRARISVNRKEIHLGLFDTFEEAVESRINAEIKYFGDFRRVDNVSQVINLIKSEPDKKLRVEVEE